LIAALTPGTAARRGAGYAIVLTAAVVAIAMGLSMRPSGSPILDPLGGIVFGLGMAGLMGLGVGLALSLLAGLARLLTWKGFGAAAFLVILLFMFRLHFGLAVPLALGIITAQGLLGGAIASLLAANRGGASRLKRAGLAALAVLGLAANFGAAVWLVSPGCEAHLVAAPADPNPPPPLEIEDPALPGPFPVRAFTYGSGHDRRRPEFAAGAEFVSRTVDATPFVKGNDGFKRRARRWYWGFDYDAFPLNGRVWLPEGPGRFPLVLVVHGNHKMEEYSDPGYAYLGEHLAGRGFIVVSVDANFFNGTWSGGLDTENDGRGWLLLQHLTLWRDWSREADHPLGALVDMERIALIGHSRGGEAAAIAGAFNRLSHYPDDATVTFDFAFPIRAVIAIAPSDGQYNPASRPTPLDDISYLALQGGHDADVSSFSGARQYERAAFSGSEYRFKASVYSYRSNHGQFNTEWGRHDFGRPLSVLLNTRPLLDGDEQRRMGTVFMTAFLEASLMERLEYLDLFRDPRRGAAWLPADDILITRFADSQRLVVADYSEDVDVTTATLPGATIRGDGLALWREGYLALRSSTQRNPAAVLGWRAPADGGDPPFYAITLPAGQAAAWGLDSDSVLTFSAAPSTAALPALEEPAPNDLPDGNGGGENGEPAAPDCPSDDDAAPSEENGPKPPPAFTVELRTSDGVTVTLASDEVRPLPPVLRSRFTKFWSDPKGFGGDTEPVLQSFGIPLARFADRAPDFDPARLQEIRFVFDRTPEGVILLDDIALGPSPPAAHPRETMDAHQSDR